LLLAVAEPQGVMAGLLQMVVVVVEQGAYLQVFLA
jgi:hypothetical protein